MAKAKTGKRRGRPAGSGIYDGGILRVAVSDEMLRRLEVFREAEKLNNVSEAARRALDRSLPPVR